MSRGTFVKEITVIDPDSKGEVQLSVYKHENGGMFAIDSSFLEQVADEEEAKDCYVIPDPFGDLMEPGTLELYDE